MSNYSHKSPEMELDIPHRINHKIPLCFSNTQHTVFVEDFRFGHVYDFAFKVNKGCL